MRFEKLRRPRLSVGLALAIAGCAAFAAVAGADPVPRVQDCGIVTISSPTKYICKGKVYTAYQLQHLREEPSSSPADSVNTSHKVKHLQDPPAVGSKKGS